MDFRIRLARPAYERKFQFAHFRQRSINLLRKQVVKPPAGLDVGQVEAKGDRVGVVRVANVDRQLGQAALCMKGVVNAR